MHKNAAGQKPHAFRAKTTLIPGLDCRVMADSVQADAMAAVSKVPSRGLNDRGGAGPDSGWGAGKHAWQTTELIVSG